MKYGKTMITPNMIFSFFTFLAVLVIYELVHVQGSAKLPFPVCDNIQNEVVSKNRKKILDTWQWNSYLAEHCKLIIVRQGWGSYFSNGT